jgi:hypothetical protein
LGIQTGFTDDSLTVNQSLLSSYRSDNGNENTSDDNFGFLLSRSSFTASTERLFVQLRADAYAFFGLPKCVQGEGGGEQCQSLPLMENEDELFIERMTLRYSVDDWVLSGGDFFRQMGKGLMLAIRKQDEAAVDSSIRGGQVEYSGEYLDGYVFAGHVNPANFDTVSLATLEDVDDLLIGGSVGLIGWPVQISLLALHSSPSQRILNHRSEINSFGVGLEAPGLLDWAAFSFEFDAQHRSIAGQRCDPLSGDCAGFASYAAVDLFFDESSLLLEFLWLDGFEQRGSRNTALDKAFDYNLPPTLQRIDQEVLDQRDVLSGRARLDFPLFSETLRGGVDLVYREENRAALVPTHIFHGIGEGKWDYDEGLSRLGLSGGYRHELQLQSVTPEGRLFDTTHTLKSMAHGELDWVQRLVKELSLHVQYRHEQRTLEEKNYERGDLVLAIEWSRVGALAFDFGYDTQKPEEQARRFFFAGLVNAELGQGWALRMLAGTQRGGIRCVAGVCREYPAFAGAEAQLVGRF